MGVIDEIGHAKRDRDAGGGAERAQDGAFDHRRRDVVAGEWHSHDDRGYTNVSAFAEHYKLKLWSNFTYFEADPLRGDQFAMLQEYLHSIDSAVVDIGASTSPSSLR